MSIFSAPLANTTGSPRIRRLVRRIGSKVTGQDSQLRFFADHLKYAAGVMCGFVGLVAFGFELEGAVVDVECSPSRSRTSPARLSVRLPVSTTT